MYHNILTRIYKILSHPLPFLFGSLSMNLKICVSCTRSKAIISLLAFVRCLQWVALLLVKNFFIISVTTVLKCKFRLSAGFLFSVTSTPCTFEDFYYVVFIILPMFLSIIIVHSHFDSPFKLVILLLMYSFHICLNLYKYPYIYIFIFAF